MKFYEVAKRHWFLLQYREALILGKLSPQRKIAPYKYQAIIVSGSIYFFLSPMASWGEKKNHLVWAGSKPRSSCFTRDRSNHLTMPPRAPLPSGWIRQLVGERGEKQLLVPHWSCPSLVAAHQRWFPEQPGAGRAGVPPRPGPGLSGWPERPRAGPGKFCGLRSSASSKSTKHKTQNTKHKTTATQEFWKWKKGLWTGDILG